MHPYQLFLSVKNRLSGSPLLRRIGKNFSIGFVGSVLLLLVSLGRTALLTKNLAIADYGRILVVLNFFGFVSMLFGLRVNDFIYRFFPQFKERQEYSELKGMLILSFTLSLLVGLVVGLGPYFTSTWISHTFYHDVYYAPLFRIYALAGFFAAFEGFSTAILRLHDRFVLIVFPHVIGAAVSVAAIGGKIIHSGSITMEFALGCIMGGMLLTTVPTLLLSLLCVSPIIAKTKGLGFRSLMSHRGRLFSTLFQTNLTGYLKLGSETGGMFLLGLLAPPAQVALYGIARQLAKVLTVVQGNIQNAVTPEIVSLWAQKKVKQLYKLVNTYTRWALIGGAVIAVIAVLLSKPVILIFTTPKYLEALPVFYVFMFTIYLTFVSLVYFPLALTMDQLGRRNLVVSSRLLYLALGVCIGLNAMVLALVQLGGALTIRLFNDIPLLRRLKMMQEKG
jgi:O-antigen/teichoic acid export membrane protein